MSPTRARRGRRQGPLRAGGHPSLRSWQALPMPPAAVTVRPEQPGEAHAIGALHDRAFGTPQESRLVEALRAGDAFLADLALVAVLDGLLVGHVLFSRIAVLGARPGPAVALAPLAVDPAHQRRGIGGRLLRAGLDGCRARGETLLVVLGHPAYYARFGFRPGAEQGVLAPFAVPPDAWMALALAPGAPRGTVAYPPAFAAVT